MQPKCAYIFMVNNTYMKSSCLCTTLTCIVLSFALLSGCTADVDLNHIDTSAELGMGLVFPVGSITATTNDFLGNNQVEHIYINENGIFTYRDTFRIQRTYHDVDLSQYVSETTATMSVYDQLKGNPFMSNGQITGMGVPITLTFPLSLKLEGINHELDNERLDSVRVTNAEFISTINRYDLPLQWAWIDTVKIELGSAFRLSSAQGNSIVVYKKGDGYGYNTEIPIHLDEFLLNLMKQPLDPATDQERYWSNVVDECDFVISFQFTVPKGVTLRVPQSAGFDYKLGVRFINYDAIWGMFRPSSDMYDEAEVSLAEEWNTWSLFAKANLLPLAAPRLDVNITTKIAGALKMTGDYIYIREEASGKQVYADFGGTNPHQHIEYFQNEFLHPTHSRIGDSVTVSMTFDKDPQRGHIDRLFTIRPDYFGYKFAIDFNRQETPQIRITPNTDVRVDAVYTLPFEFNEGLAFTYSDTIRGIDLSQLTLDSLLANANIIDSIKATDLKLFVKLQNNIPLQIKGVLRFLDENDRVVMEQNGASVQPLRLSDTDTLTVTPPHYTYTNGHWNIDQPGETTLILTIDKDRLETFSRVKSMYFEGHIDDKPYQSSFNDSYGSTFTVALRPEQQLKIRLGLAAQVEAVLNLNLDNQQ